MRNIHKTYIVAAAILLAAASCKQGNKPETQSVSTQENTETAANSEEDVPTISFTMTDMDGNEVAVSDEFAKHEITIVDFWASWCGPCIREMPTLVATYGKYKDKGLGIVGVSLDENKDQWTSAVRQMGMEWLQLSDLQGWHNAAAQMYGIQAIPFTIIVDKDGKVITAGLRGEELTAFVANRLDGFKGEEVKR